MVRNLNSSHGTGHSTGYRQDDDADIEISSGADYGSSCTHCKTVAHGARFDRANDEERPGHGAIRNDSREGDETFSVERVNARPGFNERWIGELEQQPKFLRDLLEVVGTVAELQDNRRGLVQMVNPVGACVKDDQTIFGLENLQTRFEDRPKFMMLRIHPHDFIFLPLDLA
ncbi:MAG: hypothetical protein WAN30_03985 [Acidimicrobiales bacterium]